VANTVAFCHTIQEVIARMSYNLSSYDSAE